MIKKIQIIQPDDVIKTASLHNRKLHYIYLGTKKPEIEIQLKNADANEVLIDFHDEKFNQKCVAAYIDLLGTLSLKYSSVFWWATFTASRNKFVSRLLPDLFTFISLVKIIENEEYPQFLIINAPYPVVYSLKKYCINHSIEIESRYPQTKPVLSAVKSSLAGGAHSCRFILSMWAKICISRLLFARTVSQRVSSKKSWYVIRTWVYDRSIDEHGKYHDSFFGVLPEFIQKNRNLVIIAGIIGDFPNVAWKARSVNEFIIIPQEYFLSFFDPVRAIIDARKNTIRIEEDVFFLGNDILAILQAELERDFTFFVPHQYLYSFWIRRMQKMFPIETFVTTYENNPWEKVCFLSLRQNQDQIKIYGYQHAVLALSSLNMVVSSVEKTIIPLPDKIITIGEITKRFLEERGKIPPEIVKIGCGLRFIQSIPSENKFCTKNYCLLVAPEGGLSESVNLVTFVFNALKNVKNLKVIIRSHPELPFDQYSKYLHFDISRHPQFSLSTVPDIQEDLAACDILIYRGSSVAIDGLKTGMGLIHVKLQDILPVDPLFDCQWLKWTVGDEPGLRRAVEEIYAMNDETYQKSLHEAREYLKKYFYEVTDERLQVFI